MIDWCEDLGIDLGTRNDLASLPKEDNFDCIYGYIVNPRAQETPITNLAQWSYVTFGAGISEKYFIPYNRKIWAVPLDQMETSWLGGRASRSRSSTTWSEARTSSSRGMSAC